MDLKQLTYFVRVADLGSYSKASEALSVSQPFISKQVRQLEVEFGAHFFRRTGRGITLTAEGEMFLARARSILEQVSGARQDLASLKHSPTGKVVLGVVSQVSPTLGATLVTQFATLFPRASLKIIEAKSFEISEWLASGRIDIGVLNDPAPTQHSDVEITPLVTRELCLVSSRQTTRLRPSQKVRFRELAELPLILPGNPQPLQELIDEVAAKEGVKLVSAHDVIGRAYTLELVCKGLGYMVMTRHAAEKIKQTHGLQINEIIEPRISTTFACLVSTKTGNLGLMRKTAALVQQIMTEQA